MSDPVGIVLRAEANLLNSKEPAVDDVHWMEEAAARVPREARRVEDWTKWWFKALEDEYAKRAADRRRLASLAAEKHAQLALVVRATLPLLDELHCIGGTMLWLHVGRSPLYCILELFAATSGTPRERLYTADVNDSDWPWLAHTAGALIEGETNPDNGLTMRLPLFSLGQVDRLSDVEAFVSSEQLLPPSKDPRVLLVDGMDRLEEIEGIAGDAAKVEELRRHLKRVASKNGAKAILRSSFADERIMLNSSDTHRYIDQSWQSFVARVSASTT